MLSVRPLGRNTFIRFRLSVKIQTCPIYVAAKRRLEFGPDDVVRAMLHPNRVFTFYHEDKLNRAGRSRPQIMQKSDAAWSALLHQPGNWVKASPCLYAARMRTAIVLEAYPRPSDIFIAREIFSVAAARSGC